jgi:DNA-nicking Smr family endonuclease
VSVRKPPPQSKPERAGVWSELGEEDRLLFEREFADVAPLRKGSERVLLEGSPAVPKVADTGARHASRVGDELVVNRQGGGITGASHGVSRETLRALARGDIRAEDTCDLHGLGAEAARHRIQHFVRDSAIVGIRAVLVICGRGLHSGGDGPVLRDVAIQVLCGRQARAHVLGFSTAAPARGGDGALAVLLRRPAKAV